MSTNRPIIAILTDRYYTYQADLVESLACELSSAGYGSLCVTGTELQEWSTSGSTALTANSIYSAVNQFGVSGIIVMSGALTHGHAGEGILELIDQISVPKVSMGMQIPNIHSVYLNEMKGMTKLMEHLLDNNERDHFAYIRGHQNDHYSMRREAVFKAHLEKHGHDVNKCVIVEGDYDPFTTYRAIDELFSNQVPLDCIVAANDVMAASAARAAKAHGIDIPSQLWISGFDDTIDATRHSPAITTVRQPSNKLARASVGLLLQQLQQPETAFTSNDSVCIPTELIIRRSTIQADNEYPQTDAFDEAELRQLLIVSMYGLGMPGNLTMEDVSKPLWQTLVNGSADIITFAQGLATESITQNAHWCINICDQVENISRQLLSGKEDVGRMAIVSSAVFLVREKVWALEMDERFETTRLQNADSDMMLGMSASADEQEIKSIMDDWLSTKNPLRCFLVRYTNAGPNPDDHAQLMHVYRNAASETPDSTVFESKHILPAEYQNELSLGLLVLCPICVDNFMFGYLLLDPRDIFLPRIEAAAHCIGNAMRTHFHLDALKDQRDSLESVNQELEQLANYDALTGLANRLQFTQYLEECCESTPECPDGKPFHLLFIDLDGFKLINDTLGHNVGDQLLGLVAQRLVNEIERSTNYDGFISRLGGDEFTVILHNMNTANEVSQVTQKILDLISSPYQLNENEVSISASIGCACFPTDSAIAENIVQYADIAMYKAKDSGKNKIVLFNSDMISADKHELQMAQDLRHALDHNELCMYYQPRIDLHTEKMCAAEALMRWLVETPDGVKPKAYPDVFIALAEKIGVIQQLDTYALNYSCKQAAQWSEAGTPLPISVNVSVKQLQQPEFVPTVKKALEEHKLDPSLLELEITETAAMTDVEDNIAKLTEIKSLGITISIDDFGTGYSSLNYLKRLPVDHLKIDRSFIMDIDQSDGGDSADASIVRSVVALGKSMGFGLVAEGIETVEQRNFVKSLECDQAQGYLYAQPLPADQITDSLLSDVEDDQDKDIAA